MRQSRKRNGRGFSPDNPYAFQYHWYNNTQPENLDFLRELRALLDRYPDVAALGEISSEDSLATMAEYTGPGLLHMGYSFELLTEDGSARYIRDTVMALESRMTQGWPCWAISNHDVPRVASRWVARDAPPHAASALTAMACSLRGSMCVFQGEELGLTEAELSYDLLRDPYGIAFWPTFKGRDGCRTPMPWNGTEHGGFTRGTPWLPLPAAHLARSVAQQERDDASSLQRFRRFLAWRARQPALKWGEVRLLEGSEAVLCFERSHADQRLRAYFNTSNATCEVTHDLPASAQLANGHGLVAGSLEARRVVLPPYAALFIALP